MTNPRISGLLMGTGGGNGWGRYIFYLNCLVPGLLKDHKAISQNRAAPLEERRAGVMKLKFSELGLLWEQNIINMSFVSGYVGSSVHGILQARTLQWVAISSSNADLVTCDTEAFISWSYSAYVLLCVFMPKSFTPFYPVLSRLLIIFHISLFC